MQMPNAARLPTPISAPALVLVAEPFHRISAQFRNRTADSTMRPPLHRSPLACLHRPERRSRRSAESRPSIHPLRMTSRLHARLSVRDAELR
jgi:hypothetical protein